MVLQKCTVPTTFFALHKRRTGNNTMAAEVTGRGDPFVLPGKPCAPHIENLVLRQEGTGTYHTTPEMWLQDQYRDTLGSLAQRYDLLMLTSLAHNNCNARTRRELLEKMVDPLQLKEDPRYLQEQYGDALPLVVVGEKRKRDPPQI